MDCCNYVYAGHFYQQQQHQFCYDNTAPYMPSSSIEANARYNFLPPTYPDYVYNPKEARIRKALREQSRELSRQTLQRNSANVTPTGAGAGGGLRSSMTGSSSRSNFLDPVSLASSLSSIPDNDPCRGNDSWFSNNGSHHPADIVGVHSRGIDRSKAMMKSFPMGFGYSEFQECAGVNSDYRVPEFPEGQKWHPYQSNPYHMRPPGPSGNVIHGTTACRSLQEHSWGQFCGVPLPATTNIHNTPRRSRQMVFLQDRQNLPYLEREDLDSQMKMCYRRPVVQETQRDRVPLTSAYEDSASQQQQPPPPPQQQQQQQSQNTRFVTQRCATEKRESLTEEMSTSTGSISGKDSSRKVPAEDHPEPEEDPNQTSSDTDELPTSSSSTKTSGCRLQPLPGFHQAFGSTEIGRFSRSEIFASMFGESTSVSSTATKSHESTVSSSPAVSSSPEEKLPSSSSSSSSSSMMSSSSTSSSSSSASSSNSSYQQATGNLAIAVGVAASYRTGDFNLQQQRWHNPYFPNAIRGEI